jgi:hypothetical protein
LTVFNNYFANRIGFGVVAAALVVGGGVQGKTSRGVHQLFCKNLMGDANDSSEWRFYAGTEKDEQCVCSDDNV